MKGIMKKESVITIDYQST